MRKSVEIAVSVLWFELAHCAEDTCKSFIRLILQRKVPKYILRTALKLLHLKGVWGLLF
jgi:hypothetical protein